MIRFLLLTFILISFIQPVASIASQIPNIRNVFFIKNMDEVSYKTAKTALRLWFKKFSNKAGFTSNTKFYINTKIIKEETAKKKIDSLVLSPYLYLQNIEFYKNYYKNGWVKTEKDGKPFFRYIIIGRKDAKPKKKLLVHYYVYSLLSKIVAKRYALEHNISIETEATDKKSKPILNLFFKKCDLAVVTQNSWELMKELNPQISNQLKVVYESNRIFIDMITLFSKNMSSKAKNAYLKALSTINNTNTGREMSRLFKFNGITQFRDIQLIPMIKYYESYLKLEANHAK